MRKKKSNNIKNQKLLIILIVVLSILLLFSLYKVLFSKIRIKELKNTNYELKYDSTWKVKKKKDNYVLLKHKSGSTIDIDITKISDEYKYSNIDELIDEIIYTAGKDNKTFKLISKESTKITERQINGYKLLYEDGNSQAYINIYKVSDKLVTLKYEAKNDYFDIVLDSAQFIIYNFKLKAEKFDIKNSISLKTNKISYTKDSDITVKKTKEHEIAAKNYQVKYSIPDSFKSTSIDSQFQYFTFDGLESGKSLSLNTKIYSQNMYEYLDKNTTVNIYSSYKSYKDTNDYKDYKESIDKFDSDYDSYIYKNSYTYTKGFGYEGGKTITRDVLHENVILVYALDNYHILLIEINATNVGITKDLIDSIKINEVKNYSSYIKIEKEDNYLIGNLMKYYDYNDDKILNIKLKVPDKYKEYDDSSILTNNIYEERYYGIDYNEKLEKYNISVKYEIRVGDENSIIDSINSTFTTSYGDCNYLTNNGTFTSNDKIFNRYSGNYTNLGGIMFTNIDRIRYQVNKIVLIYPLENNDKLVIEVTGNDREISDEILNELTNFEVKTN